VWGCHLRRVRPAARRGLLSVQALPAPDRNRGLGHRAHARVPELTPPQLNRGIDRSPRIWDVIPAVSRPWLFLDLDGVVSPLPPRGVAEDEQKFAIPAGHMTWPGALYEMHVDERLPAWARQLDHAYDVVWATSWQTDVLKCVAQPLGLPEWPVLTWPLGAPVPRRMGRGRVRFKTQSIAKHLHASPRPFAWG
jgi:hypothetical protein